MKGCGGKKNPVMESFLTARSTRGGHSESPDKRPKGSSWNILRILHCLATVGALAFSLFYTDTSCYAIPRAWFVWQPKYHGRATESNERSLRREVGARQTTCSKPRGI